jgi:hypothetical protein
MQWAAAANAANWHLAISRNVTWGHFAQSKMSLILMGGNLSKNLANFT